MKKKIDIEEREENDDIYSVGYMEELEENDEISTAEQGFMEGYIGV